jgi:hypothetical protein
VSNPKADVNATEATLREPARVSGEARARFAGEIVRRQAQSDRLSLTRLLAFIASGALIATAFAEHAGWAWMLGLTCAAVFAVAVIAQQRVLSALDGARIRHDVHERHLMRIDGRFGELESRGEKLLPRTHAYAWDIDLLGQGSLFQRIDVTHTVHGERLLGDWLGRAAAHEVIRARQQAVSELARMVELRQELEASALLARGSGKLDGRPFREFAELPSYFAPRAWLRVAIVVLPLLTLALYLAGRAHVLAAGLWLVPVGAQLALLWSSGHAVRRAFDLAAARQGVAEAFEGMLRVVERAQFESPLLRAIQGRLAVGGTPPSAHMRSLQSWSSAAELRQQFLFYVLVNPLTLWDLHVLHGLERWNARVGRNTSDWFEALGELEALSSLATLAFGDPDARMPDIAAPRSADPSTSAPALRGGALRARELCHPLLPPETRVSNDVALDGPGCALIVTGSNMAGKSTLLRALGLNVVLALAGGPVCAAALSLPIVRLRASMRADDSLQQGASYFHAELTKLRGVVEDAQAEPPVLFLLDELLRGTNARARHIGARAVLLHLLARGAMGAVATHDVALSELEREQPGRVTNVHFTDVVENGEMRFDYRLRPGVVRTSNALRLLALAGIDVPETDAALIDVLETHAAGAERA